MTTYHSEVIANATVYRTVETLLRMAGDHELGSERTIYGVALQAERRMEELRFQLSKATGEIERLKQRFADYDYRVDQCKKIHEFADRCGIKEAHSVGFGLLWPLLREWADKNMRFRDECLRACD